MPGTSFYLGAAPSFFLAPRELEWSCSQVPRAAVLLGPGNCRGTHLLLPDSLLLMALACFLPNLNSTNTQSIREKSKSALSFTSALVK